VKALGRNVEVHHDTIAHFTSHQAETVKDLFVQVLIKCYALGLIGGELFTLRLQAAFQHGKGMVGNP
jgi:hypothetical protein